MKPIKIEKNIPIPSPFDSGPRIPKSDIANALPKMKSGDSIVLPVDDDAFAPAHGLQN